MPAPTLEGRLLCTSGAAYAITGTEPTLAREIIRFHLPQIAMDHAIGCGSGYMTAVAPAGVCPPVLP